MHCTRNNGDYLLTILSMCVTLCQTDSGNPIFTYRLDKQIKPSTILSTSNTTHFCVKGTACPYQHSAENTCFGIIKWRSKQSTSKGKEELDPLSTQRLLCRKWAFRACSNQPLRYYNCIRGDQWREKHYWCYIKWGWWQYLPRCVLWEIQWKFFSCFRTTGLLKLSAIKFNSIFFFFFFKRGFMIHFTQ